MKASTLFGVVLAVAGAGAAFYVLSKDTACAGWEPTQVRQIVLQELRDQAPVDPDIPDAHDARIDENAITYTDETWVVPLVVSDRLGTSQNFIGTISCLGGGMIAISKAPD